MEDIVVSKVNTEIITNPEWYQEVILALRSYAEDLLSKGIIKSICLDTLIYNANTLCNYMYYAHYNGKNDILGICGMLPNKDIITGRDNAIEFIWHANISLPLKTKYRVLRRLLQVMVSEFNDSKADKLLIGIEINNPLKRLLFENNFKLVSEVWELRR